MTLIPLFADLEKLETAIGLPPKFIEALTEEDDWSFVIKSHAIIEAAIGQMLALQFDPRLSDIVHRMPLSGDRFSKISVIKKLELLDSPSIAVIQRIGQIRNRLVHDVKHLSFNIESYFRSLDVKDRKQFASQLSRMAAETDNSEFNDFLDEALAEYPKELLSLAILYVLGKTLFRIDPLEEPKAAENLEASKFFIALIALFALLASMLSDGTKSGDR